jgi:hypothetical protein
MKIVKIAIFIFFIAKTNLVYSQTDDTTAIKIVESSLKTIGDYLKDNKSDSAGLRSRAIWFLTTLTGIPSQSDGNFFGQFSPTLQDYNNWKNWLMFYKNYLKWDKTRNVIIVSNEVKVLEENRPPKANSNVSN